MVTGVARDHVPERRDLVVGRAGRGGVGRRQPRHPGQGPCVGEGSRAGQGFSLNTPTTSIIDLGTEFGVALSNSGSTAVQVYAGKVLAGRHSDRGPKRELAAGEAMEFDADPLRRRARWPLHPIAFCGKCPRTTCAAKERGAVQRQPLRYAARGARQAAGRRRWGPGRVGSFRRIRGPVPAAVRRPLLRARLHDVRRRASLLGRAGRRSPTAAQLDLSRVGTDRPRTVLAGRQHPGLVVDRSRVGLAGGSLSARLRPKR
jgi:hypothetical protein